MAPSGPWSAQRAGSVLGFLRETPIDVSRAHALKLILSVWGKGPPETKFMSKFAFVIAAMLAASSLSAFAEEKMVVDMRKLTCSQLTKLGFQDFAGLTMWLSGYYNSSIRNTVVDLEQYARAANKVKEFCQTNGRATVLSATERVLGIKMPR
jgi:acid stress chaperone HdeB